MSRRLVWLAGGIPVVGVLVLLCVVYATQQGDQAPTQSAMRSSAATPASAPSGGLTAGGPTKRASEILNRLLSGNKLVKPENPSAPELEAYQVAQELVTKGYEPAFAAADAAMKVDAQLRVQERNARIDEKRTEGLEHGAKVKAAQKAKVEELKARRPERPRPPEGTYPDARELKLGPALTEDSSTIKPGEKPQ